MSQNGPDEYPDGSVGRYVRERWAQNAERSQRQAPDERRDQRREEQQGGAHAEHPGLGARRDETWGVVPDDAGWGSDLLELEGELDEVEPYPAGGPAGRHVEPEQRREERPDRPADRRPGPRHTEPPAQRTGSDQRPAPGASQVANGATTHGAAPHDPAPHDPAPHGAPPDGTPPNGTAPIGTPPIGTPPIGTAPNGAADGTQPSNTAANSTAQGGTAPNGTPPNGSPPNGTVPNGVRRGAAPHTAEPRSRETGRAEPPPPPPASPPPAAQWRTAGQRSAQERRIVPQEGRTPPRGMPLGPPTGPNRPIRDVGRWTDPGAVAAQEAQQARADSNADVADLSTARLLKPSKRRPPRTGWRRFLYLLTGRLINPGESPQDIRERELTTRINQPLLGCHKIATLSLKGGVGKTTITATLGATFASLRGDRVVAVDANPDRGTLSQKIPLETSATVRHLLRDAQRIRRYTDVRAYTSQGPSRLEVLASEQDPAVSEAFSEDDYRRTVTLLEHFYNIVLTDCGTGLMHSAMYGVLGVADQLIIVSSGSIDGARSASATMDWLEAHDHGDLVRNAVAVINNVHRQAGAVDLERVAQHFAGRCRAVVQIPFDPHLEEGAEVDLERLSPPTRLALLELAASVADGFPS
ncbi:nucleotide-binding protein [Pseudonocardia terrae]|uniref:nucleotide-binding protein n=1 Tax=Pseudonocardia terrae TaxID=2905831 RepID=UPI003FD80DD9